MNCQCDLKPPFHCPILNMMMGRNAHAMCINKDNNPRFERWKKWKLSPNSEQHVQVVHKGKPVRKVSAGAGTELKALLKSVGIKGSVSCGCAKRAREMDDRGIQWCEEHVEVIVGWLRDAARKQQVPFVDLIARQVVKLAVRRAKKKEKVSG